MVPGAAPRHDDGMVNIWTWSLLAGTAVAAVLTFLLAAALPGAGRAPSGLAPCWSR